MRKSKGNAREAHIRRYYLCYHYLHIGLPLQAGKTFTITNQLPSCWRLNPLHIYVCVYIHISYLHMLEISNNRKKVVGPMYMFDKVFASFLFWHAKTCTKNKRTSIETHILEVDTYYDLWRKKRTSFDILEIEMTCVTRQLEYKL